MKRREFIKKFIEFYKDKNHKEIQNASLVPENDPTVLFTTAGMHPLVPYLLGKPHPQGKRLVNIQRCIRTGDIDEVGDKVHHTFFEMAGKWSLGDYFKEDAIKYTFEFLTNEIKIPVEKLAVTCFKGDKNVLKDIEAAKIWEGLGISKDRIVFLGKKDNWWGPAGVTGPCGPDTEVFYWSANKKPPKKFDSEDKSWVEIGNDVLMQYEKDEKGKYNSASQKNIDFGGGVERTIAILNGMNDNYKTEIWIPIIKIIEKLSKKSYDDNKKIKRSMRIIADHLKASVFIIADGVVPSNSERGYILRRLIRRAIRHGKKLGISDFIKEVSKPVFEIYDDYPHLLKNKNNILSELDREERNFNKTLIKGLSAFEKLSKGKKVIKGKESFLLFQSYGFPIEMTEELAREKKIRVDRDGYEKEFLRHQELSRTATSGKFKSGLQDDSEMTTRLHTATHLLLASLKKVLKNPDIVQRGSNINSERLRFDFTFDRKLTNEEIKNVEELVNKKINENLVVSSEEMNLKKAKEKGATGIFDEKYSDIISVYTIGDKKNYFSKEICTGPHVNNTKELGKFKIKKEESSSRGVRRIKAILE